MERSFPPRRRAIIALVLVNAMWGSSFPVMKCLNLQVDQHFGVTELTASSELRAASAAGMIAIRFGLAVVLLGLLMPSTWKRVRLPHALAGAAIGAMFFLGLLLQVVGLATIPASRSGFLTSLAVVFTPLLSTLYQRRMPRIPILLAALVALTGVAVLTGLVVIQDGSLRLAEDALQQWRWGDFLTTAAALAFSVQILLVDGLGKRYDSSAFTPSMFVTTTLLGTWLFGLLHGQVPEVAASELTTRGPWFSLSTQWAFWTLIVMLAVFPSWLAFTWMNKYQVALSAVQAAVIYTLEPVFASLWAMLLPATLAVVCCVVYANEQFSVPLVLGGTLVLMANILALWPQRSAEDEGQATT